MLTFEHMASSILTAANMAGLDVYGLEQKFETITCDREFRCLCVPQGLKPPYKIIAELSFGWDCAMTTETIFDDYAPDCSDEEETEGCFVELEIKYHFALEKFDQFDEADQELKKLFARTIKHENIPHTHCELVIDDKGEKVVFKSWAEYYWEVSYLEEPEELGGICAEIYRVLKEIRKLPLLKGK